MIFADGVEDYLRSIIPAPDPVLAEMIAHGERDDVPIVYPETGALLEVLVALTGARRAVEVGTAIGVSTLHIARALEDGGTVISFEVDAARHEAARGYLGRAGLADRVDLRLKDGAEGLAELEGQFDFAFIDADKPNYPAYYERLLKLVRQGGLIAVDNTLALSGAPIIELDSTHAQAMLAFNELARKDERVELAMLTVGEGVTLLRVR